MPFQVIPRERAFYELLERAADRVHDGARSLLELVEDPDSAVAQGARIHTIEEASDELTHEIIELLNHTFVTPFDRADIHELASSLDDVVDAVDSVAELLILHRIEQPLPQFRLQVAILVDATDAVARAVRGLRSLSAPNRIIVEILRFERDGDHVYRRAVAELYSGEYRARDVLAWRDLLEQLEQAIDRCEDIANTIESIHVKYA
jgi:predicted phosphate transport protein (TIGR00153 family)